MERNHNMNIQKASGLRQWMQIYFLYRNAFPRAERRPFSAIRSMSKSGKVDVWYFEEKGEFAGLATTINGDNQLTLLDYFAVSAKNRDRGWGSKMIPLIVNQYKGRHLFGEIEALDPAADNYEDRKRRKQFYLRLGLVDLGIYVRFFGVEMELLSSGYPITYQEYEDFYRKNLGEAFVRHLEEIKK